MRAVEGQTVQPCPRCGVEIRTDRRFTAWCAACDWNVDPQGSAEERGGLGRLRRGLAQRHGDRLVSELGSGDERHRGGGTAAGTLTYAIALTVHAVTVVLAAGGVWFLVGGWGGFGMLPGLFLLALAWTLRPRLNRLPEHATVLSRDDAPELYAQIDEVAALLGTRSVDIVVVDAQTNASVTHLGLRRRLLTLGLPLWEILTPQQRVALLGHELGHFTNGDTRHGVIVGTAYGSLTTWHYYLSPIERPTLVEAFVNLLYFVPRCLITGLVLLLDLLTSRSAQRSEYLADAMAARAGSTEAAIGLMDRLLVAESVDTTLSREVNARRMRGPGRTASDEAEGMWEALSDHMDSIPESEVERQRRVGALRGHSVDATHPPTHLRRRVLLDGPPLPASVEADAERSRHLASELAGPRAAVARKLVRDGLDWR